MFSAFFLLPLEQRTARDRGAVGSPAACSLHGEEKCSLLGERRSVFCRRPDGERGPSRSPSSVVGMQPRCRCSRFAAIMAGGVFDAAVLRCTTSVACWRIMLVATVPPMDSPIAAIGHATAGFLQQRAADAMMVLH